KKKFKIAKTGGLSLARQRAIDKRKKRIPRRLTEAEIRRNRSAFEEMDDLDKSLEEDLKELEKSTGEKPEEDLGEDPAEYVMEKSRSTDGKKEIYKVRKRDLGKREKNPPLRLAAFSGALITVSDSNDNSLSTIDVAWIPRYQFGETQKWEARLNFGVHSFEIKSAAVNESFLIYDIGAYLAYRIYQGLYFSLGFGVQQWQNTAGESYGTNSIGVGYQFDTYKLKVIDRLWLDYTAVGNTEENKEIKFALGLSF
ncbi:MAG: hypothetical protein HN509_16175, partial [Halobacteriovoraceae bacterium]|nr:hypothetical protein [Halobacteriovoraceae bacterium]MBT5094202.1 hypothetical protein [Halobacteriovoraceae bacterium]